MTKWRLLVVMPVTILACVLFAGCVERKLTINTQPKGAQVLLNDEDIGASPVTVGFNWYGDYSVRISKEGYETLNTHRKLKAPWYDYFPFDFFAQVLNPTRITDSYKWTFELEPKKLIGREELLNNAEKLKERL